MNRIHTFYTVLFLCLTFLQIRGERCFTDEDCKNNEFCNKDDSGRFTICRPCISCKDYHKQNYDQMSMCIKTIIDCGKCLDGYEFGFENGNVLPHCVPTPIPQVDDGLLSNTSRNHSSLLSQQNNSSEEIDDSTAKSAGIIAGAVAMAVVAVAALAFGGVVGYKYYRHKKNSKQHEEERTVELQELEPKPAEVLTIIDETEKTQQIEQKQTL